MTNVDQHSHPYERRRPNVIALVLALVVTPTIFSAVVSIANEPPSAIAGKRIDTTVAAAKVDVKDGTVVALAGQKR